MSETVEVARAEADAAVAEVDAVVAAEAAEVAVEAAEEAVALAGDVASLAEAAAAETVVEAQIEAAEVIAETEGELSWLRVQMGDTQAAVLQLKAGQEAQEMKLDLLLAALTALTPLPSPPTETTGEPPPEESAPLEGPEKTEAQPEAAAEPESKKRHRPRL